MDLCNYSEIKKLLERHGFNFSKALGQNFLTAAWVPERIAFESGIDSTVGVLEIGPGIGCLTVCLAASSKKVLAVELDKRLIDVLDETLGDCDNIKVIQGDIMKLDIRALISENLAGMPLHVCANLPYNITTPVLTRLIETNMFDTITVMLQREVALRICAVPGTPDYGAFTVFCNYYMQPEILFDVPPDCFVPRPKVTSSVIKMRNRQGPPCKIADEKHFFKVTRAAFSQRRKTLVNCLTSVFGNDLSKSALEEIVTSLGLDARVRGETLSIGEFAQISAAISARCEQ